MAPAITRPGWDRLAALDGALAGAEWVLDTALTGALALTAAFGMGLVGAVVVDATTTGALALDMEAAEPAVFKDRGGAGVPAFLAIGLAVEPAVVPVGAVVTVCRGGAVTSRMARSAAVAAAADAASTAAAAS